MSAFLGALLRCPQGEAKAASFKVFWSWSERSRVGSAPEVLGSRSAGLREFPLMGGFVGADSSLVPNTSTQWGLHSFGWISDRKGPADLDGASSPGRSAPLLALELEQEINKILRKVDGCTGQAKAALRKRLPAFCNIILGPPLRLKISWMADSGVKFRSPFIPRPLNSVRAIRNYVVEIRTSLI